MDIKLAKVWQVAFTRGKECEAVIGHSYPKDRLFNGILQNDWILARHLTAM